MNIGFRYFLIALLALVFFASSSARAENYEHPSYEVLVKMLVRFGALDLADDDILDEYAMAEECDLFKKFYSDDFKWNKFRGALRQSLRLNIETFPTTIYYPAVLQFDRYDFKTKTYKFMAAASPLGANSFTLHDTPTCGMKKFALFPQFFRLLLDRSVELDGLPLSEDDGKILLRHMKDTGNTDHLVYARFNMKVVSIAPLIRKREGRRLLFVPLTQDPPGPSILFNATLDSIDFYEDKEATKLIYTYQR